MAESLMSMFSPFSQTIGRFLYDPTTNWQRFFNPQLVFNYNPQDEPIEAHVLSKVGSYGSQLSTLIDAVAALTAAVDTNRLDEPQRAALAALQDLKAKADSAVDEFRGEVTEDSVIAAAKAVAKAHPERVAALRAKLEAVLAENKA